MYHPAPEICPACQAPTEKHFIEDFKSQDGSFSLYECKKCSFRFWVPFKNPGAEWYKSTEVYEARHSGIYDLKIWHKGFLKHYKKLISGKSILDVGCGTGEFLNACSSMGASEVWGLDFDPQVVDVAHKEFDLKNVFLMDLEGLLNFSGSPKFDLVTSFEVIEHLDDPNKYLENIKKILKEDGVFFLSTPSRERYLSDVSWDYPVNHISRWNGLAITNILNRNGFKVEKILYTRGFDWIYDSLREKLSFGIIKQQQVGKPINIQSKKISILRKIAWIKNIFIIGIPASIIYVWGIVIGRKNGDMLVKARYEVSNI